MTGRPDERPDELADRAGRPPGDTDTDTDTHTSTGTDTGVPGDVPAGTPAKRRKESVGQTIGGVLFGFEQQVLRTTPPPQELVHHARPDAPIPAGDGSLIHIGMPGLALPDDDDADDEADSGDTRTEDR